jgi:hypothetical protein
VGPQGQLLAGVEDRLFSLWYFIDSLVFLRVCNFLELDIVGQGGYPCGGKPVFWGLEFG